MGRRRTTTWTATVWATNAARIWTTHDATRIRLAYDDAAARIIWVADDAARNAARVDAVDALRV